MNAEQLAPLVGDLRQLAFVRAIVLDDGPERGQRALLCSTGGGLDFMVLPDRAMDIGTLSVRGLPVAWQSPAGLRSPYLTDPDSEGGTGFNRSFSGLLVTCGLESTRQPAGGAPLHGRLPGTPARLVAHGEDWERREPVLYCEGEAVQAAYGKEALRLRRRIESPIGGTTLVIRDRVDNIGPTAAAHSILYHLNFGYPAIADGTRVRLAGQPILGPIALGDAKARPQVDCRPAGPAGETQASIHTPRAGSDLDISVTFSGATLPFLQVWHDLRPRTGVLAIEPCSTARREDGGSTPGTVLQPGESRDYEIRLSFA